MEEQITASFFFDFLFKLVLSIFSSSEILEPQNLQNVLS